MTETTCYDCERSKETRVTRIPGPVGYRKDVYCAALKRYIQPRVVEASSPCKDFRERAKR